MSGEHLKICRAQCTQLSVCKSSVGMQMEDEVQIIHRAHMQATRRDQMYDTWWVSGGWLIFKESVANVKCGPYTVGAWGGEVFNPNGSKS